MSAELEHWKSQLATLSPGERAELAYFLLVSFEDENEEIEAAWEAEASRRVAEIRAGRVVGRPAEDLLAELLERYP